MSEFSIERVRARAKECQNATDGVWLEIACDRIESAQRDAERLSFLIEHSAVVSWGKDHEVCSVGRYESNDGPSIVFRRLSPKNYSDARQAIDDTMKSLESK